jgi:hypothetical protein
LNVVRYPFQTRAEEPKDERSVDLPHEELARIWTGLQAAAHTDSQARHLVEYFSGDAARLFGAGSSPR